MSDLDLPAANSEDFAATAALEGAAIRARITGNADLAARDVLEPFLVRLESEAQRLKVREVAVDLRDLEFMNSSCFKGFVTWIGALQELPAGDQYRIRFLSNPNMHWQRRSLHALKCFAVDLIDVETS
jgi:hypothetical protein